MPGGVQSGSYNMKRRALCSQLHRHPQPLTKVHQVCHASDVWELDVQHIWSGGHACVEVSCRRSQLSPLWSWVSAAHRQQESVWNGVNQRMHNACECCLFQIANGTLGMTPVYAAVRYVIFFSDEGRRWVRLEVTGRSVLHDLLSRFPWFSCYASQCWPALLAEYAELFVFCFQDLQIRAQSQGPRLVCIMLSSCETAILKCGLILKR